MKAASADLRDPSDLPVAEREQRSTLWRYVRWVGSVVALLAAAALLLLLLNNYRFSRQSRASFESQLEDQLERAVALFDSRAMNLTYYDPNSALLYMICDMAEMTDDQRLRKLLRQYQSRYPRSFWKQLVFSRHPTDSSRDVDALPSERFAALDEDKRWFHYAVGGDESLLTEPELNRLFSPTANQTRKLTHQLIALLFLQERLVDTPDLPSLIDTLCGRIASEEVLDFRVTDMYIQRVTFLLGAGRDDLVRPQWIERIMANQQVDGGWRWTWDINPFAAEQVSSDHSSVQAAWALCMIKHRFPEWIDRHYPE